jgi:hypothetical protein
MKKHGILYTPTWEHGPMTYWVHFSADGRPWHQAQVFDPPAPQPVPGKGFPVFVIEFDSAVLWFTSLAELRVCIDTLARRVLPSNRILTQKRGGSYGPSNHWLNRLPLRAMTWPYRQKVVKYLKVSLADFEITVDKETSSRVTGNTQ